MYERNKTQKVLTNQKYELKTNLSRKNLIDLIVKSRDCDKDS